MNINKSIQSLKTLKAGINPKYRAYADEVIGLFKDRKIEKTKEAEALLAKLGSRGKAPQSAIASITEKYRKAEPAIGKLTRPKEQTFFVKGVIKSSITYEKEFKKNGEIKALTYDNPDETFVLKVKAKDKATAEKIFEAGAKEHYTTTNPDEDSNVKRSKKFQGATISSIIPESSFRTETESSQLMRASTHVQYSFIPEDTTHLKTEGFCVLDQFLGRYEGAIKKLNRESFIELCYHVRGEVRPSKKEISALDRGIEGIEDDDRPNAWCISHGVSPDMLMKICEHFDISHYCFDITRQCFRKYISKNRNYKALIYYAINNHMYLITNEDEAETLSKKARDIETKIKSNCITEDETQATTNPFKDEVLENIPISDLKNYEKATIIYSKSNLNEELDQIIEQYNFIPKIRNHRYATIQITFTMDKKE